MALQAGGFVMTMWQLLETRRALNLPNWWQGIRNYFKGFPRSNTSVSMAASLPAFGIMGQANVSTTRNPKARLKDRVERLERDVEALEARVAGLEDKTESEVKLLKKALSDELEKVRSEINKFESKFSQLIGGGTTLQVVGVFYFVTGLLLASASVELSNAMQSLN